MNQLNQRIVFFLAAVNIVLGILVIFGMRSASDVYVPETSPSATRRENIQDIPELRELASMAQASFDDLADYFRNLAKRKGGQYAYEVLGQASLPPNTDLHLLGHVVGDELYEQQGISGIIVCTQDFRNACSHSIVVGALLEHGDSILSSVQDVCHKAPGGKGAYTMCYHGFGHGVLAYYGYDMRRAVALCERTGTPEYHDQEAAECMGGALMEMISGGFHDPVTWREVRPMYLQPDDPLRVCNGELIPDYARSLCYTYITPYLFEAAGANMGEPSTADFAKAFRFCDALPLPDPLRDSCFGGFGKEFVVLAQQRDIRNIDQMTVLQMRLVYDWCGLAEDPSAIKACLLSALNSIYWGGENDRAAPIRFCNVMPDETYRTTCVQQLVGAVGFYVQDRKYREAFCQELPEAYLGSCRSQLLSP